MFGLHHVMKDVARFLIVADYDVRNETILLYPRSGHMMFMQAAVRFAMIARRNDM